MKQKNNLILAISTFFTLVVGCSQMGKTPEWTKAKILANNLDHPSAITTDDKNIYYVTGGTMASLHEGTSGVWKMPLSGGQATQLFKGYQRDKDYVVLPDNFVLATDEKYIYWSSGSIWRTPKDGGEPQELTTGSPTEMVLDNEKIYWHNYVGEGMKAAPIYTADKKGSEAKAINEPANISTIAIDKEFIYWSQPDGIYQILKTGGEKKKIYSTPEKQQITDLIADSDNFYLMQGNGNMSLFKVSKKSGEVIKLAPNINNAHHFYADESNIYFVLNEGSFGTSINKVSKNGGEVTKLDSGYIASYTVGQDKIYVTDISNIYELLK